MTAWPDIKIWDIANPRAPVLTGTVTGYGFKCGGGFFPKRNWISVGGVTVRHFGFWDAESLKQIGTDMILDHFPRCAAISPDESLIAIGTMGATIELWDVASQRRVAFLKGHGDAVYALDFSPDGRTLASGSLDGTVKLWNVPTRTLLLTLDDHDNQVRAVRFSPDGQYLVTGSVDGTILVRRAMTP
jgi:WD40 repeat protein